MFVLDPRETWEDMAACDAAAVKLRDMKTSPFSHLLWHFLQNIFKQEDDNDNLENEAVY